MPVAFRSSKKPTLGVEVEVQLIDNKSRNLTPLAQAVIQAASDKPDLHVKAELTQAMVEINTDICKTVDDVRKSLEYQIGLLREILQRHEASIAVSGTHPFQVWWERQFYPSERYRAIMEKFQWLARRLTIFGLHVHVGVQDGDRAIHVINALIGYIPHLLALSSSAPFWGGRDTGLSSCRVAVFESLPMGGLPYYFPNWKEFQKYYDTLASTGAIHSIKDIYWDIRPHFDFGTIEVRICDGLPTLRETLGLVALIQCLVVWIDSQYQKGTRSREIHMQRYWLAPENKWQAARYGLDGQIIVRGGEERRLLRDDIGALLETLQPVAQSIQCEKELSYVGDILKTGPSSVRQRRVYAETRSFEAVVDSLIQELREGITPPFQRGSIS